MSKGWSFAASTQDIERLASVMKESMEATDIADEQKPQVEQAMNSLNGLLKSGLWGSGPFTVSLSGSDNSLYLAVTIR